jgi:spermidine synthase
MQTLLLYILFFLSGTTALVYELVWVRELIFVFGGTTYAITTVLVAFMAGLGLGSYLAGRSCHKLKHPARVFGYLEIGIGSYALLVPFLLGLAQPAYRALYPYAQDLPVLLTAARFLVGGLVVLLPATLMGATLPVLVRHITSQGGRVGASVGYLYGVNTFGAVLGVVAAGFFLLPAFGLEQTTRLSAAVDILVGIAALTLLPMPRPQPAPRAATVADSRALLPDFKLSGGALVMVLIGFAVSGFSSMVYQITWTRALIMSVGSSTYSFTCILAAFILGLALGSLAVARFADRFRNPVLVFGILEVLIGVVAVAIVPIHGQLPGYVAQLVRGYSDDYDVLMSLQFLLIIAITFVPTFLIGAIFPLVTRALASRGGEAGAVTGRAYAVNTIGTILGSFLAGFILIRGNVLGVQNSIILASLLNAIIGVALVIVASPNMGGALVKRVALPLLGLAVIPAVAFAAGSWDQAAMTTAPFLNRPAAKHVRVIEYYEDGVDLTVSVERNPEEEDAWSLGVNGKPDASTDLHDMLNFILLSHIPALLNPDGQDACMIGLGSGLSVGSLSCYPNYTRIDCVEISPIVIEAARTYFDDYCYNVLTEDPRVRMIPADGRNHLLLTDQTYDLILSQPSNPWMSGVSSLFTREFFELARDRLTENGLFGAWLQSYSMSKRDFRMVVRTFVNVFPHAQLWELDRSNFLLVGSRLPIQVELDEFLRRFRQPEVWADLFRISIREPADVLGRYIADRSKLVPWSEGAALHTDDNSLLEFSAPRYLYAHEGDLIMAELAKLQSSVWVDVIMPGDVPSALRNETNDVVRGRWAYLVAQLNAARNDYAGSLKALLDGFSLDPSSVDLYRTVKKAAKELSEKFPDRTQHPEIQALLQRIDHIPPPIVSTPQGGTLDAICAYFIAAAREAGRAGDWETAARHFEDAHRIRPDLPDVTHEFAAVLRRAGQYKRAAHMLDGYLQRNPDDGFAHYIRVTVAVDMDDVDAACRHLKHALVLEAVLPAEVERDSGVAALRTTPCYRQLLEDARAGRLRDDAGDAPDDAE